MTEKEYREHFESLPAVIQAVVKKAAENIYDKISERRIYGECVETCDWIESIYNAWLLYSREIDYSSVLSSYRGCPASGLLNGGELTSCAHVKCELCVTKFLLDDVYNYKLLYLQCGNKEPKCSTIPTEENGVIDYNIPNLITDF